MPLGAQTYRKCATENLCFSKKVIAFIEQASSHMPIRTYVGTYIFTYKMDSGATKCRKFAYKRRNQ